MRSRTDLSYSLRRAEQESILAIASNQPAASAAHYELCLRHSAKARAVLASAALHPDK